MNSLRHDDVRPRMNTASLPLSHRGNLPSKCPYLESRTSLVRAVGNRVARDSMNCSLFGQRYRAIFRLDGKVLDGLVASVWRCDRDDRAVG